MVSGRLRLLKSMSIRLNFALGRVQLWADVRENSDKDRSFDCTVCFCCIPCTCDGGITE